MTNKNIAYYRSLPYRRVLSRETEASGRVIYIAHVAEIPFIRMHGDTREEALLRLDQIFDDCIAALVEEGEVVPEPERWPGPISTGADPMRVAQVSSELTTEREEALGELPNFTVAPQGDMVTCAA